MKKPEVAFLWLMQNLSGMNNLEVPVANLTGKGGV